MNVDNITQSEKTTFVDSFKWRFFSKAIWIVLLAVLLAIAAIAFMGTWEETLPSTYMNNMLSRWLLPSLMMVPMVLLILQGRLDMSVGGTAALTAFVMAKIIESGNTPVFVALLGGLAIACLVGLLNGFLVGFVRLHWAVVTLGTLTLTYATAYSLTTARGALFERTDPGILASLIVPGIVLALMFVLAVLLIEFTPFGYRKWAINNATLNWVVESLMIALPYLLTGLMAGLAGAWYLGIYRFSFPGFSSGFESDVLLIALMGGAVLGKRHASLFGGLLAAAVIVLLDDILRYQVIREEWSPSWMEIFKGVLIIVFGALAYLYYLLVNLFYTRRAASRQVGASSYLPVSHSPEPPAAPPVQLPPAPLQVEPEAEIEPESVTEPETEDIAKTVIEPRQ